MIQMENKLKELIKEISDNRLNKEDINDDTNLLEDIGLDSIQIMNLVVEIEAQFEIEIGDDDLIMDKLAVFGNLKTLVINSVKDM
jgi:acyl carrier protein